MDKDFAFLAIIGFITLLQEPERKRKKAEKVRARERAEAKRREEQSRRERAQAYREKQNQDTPSAAEKPVVRRWKDSIYESYEKNGYWRGCGPGAWTSSKHPDDWEHPHLK